MRALMDRILLFGGLALVWFVVVDVLEAVDTTLFPKLTATAVALWTSLPELVNGTWASFGILIPGYLMAVVSAMAVGLALGSVPRVHGFLSPLIRMLAPVPPTVYIPYAIALLPGFRASAVFVLFVGSFWPVLINTLHGVSVVDQRYKDNARVLGFGRVKTLRTVVMPAVMPFVFSGATVALGISFITLTVAELFGASSGLGRFVQYYSDLAEYPRVVAGVIFIAVVVSATMEALDRIRKRVLSWAL